MSRCRADSFYVAPGEYRSFDDWAVFTKVGDEWKQVTHRKDVEKLSQDTSWAGLCYVVYRPSHTREAVIDIAALVKDEPERVQLWKLDARLINGKRSGVEHHLHAIARHGTARAGGVREAVGGVLGATPAGKSVARWFSEEDVTPTAQASILKILHSASFVLSPDAMQSLASKLRQDFVNTPMPVFDTSATHNLSFLERYPMERRVRLLADLWHAENLDSLNTLVRVADELLDRGGVATKSAEKLIASLDSTSAASIAELAVAGKLWVTANSSMFGPNILAELASRPATRRLVALHPENTDTSIALELLSDTSSLERREVHVYQNSKMHPDVAAALFSELSKKNAFNKTHSITRCNNLLILSIAVTEVLPEAAPLVAKAFASWTHAQGALDPWNLDALDYVFANKNIVLDKVTAEQLYKRQLEYARTAAKNDSKDGNVSPTQRWMSGELLATLECQSATPAGIKEAAREHLDKGGRDYRGVSERLVQWRSYVDTAPEPVEALLHVLTTLPDLHTNTSALKSSIKTVMQHAAALVDTDEDFQTVQKAAAAVSTHGDRDEILEQSLKVRAAIRGTIKIEEVGDMLYSNPVYSALAFSSQSLGRDLRKCVLENTNDADVAYAGYITTGETDVLSSMELSQVSREIQLRSLVSEQQDVVWPEKPKSWDELPTEDHLPWALAPVSERLDAKTVVLGDDVFDVRVIKDMSQLQANAAPNCMGNCTASYASSIRQGHALVLALGRGDSTEINVSVEYETRLGEWAITEMKGRRNKILQKDVQDALTSQIGLLLNG
jgi:hypothetical protein